MVQDTKQKLLDTAERLFAERGYDATSLRQVIAEAQVNLAAVHYHFGSKEELLDQLVANRVVPVNAERMARLDQLEGEAGRTRPEVAKVLAAFLLPMLDIAATHPQFPKLMGRLYAEGRLSSIAQKHFREVVLRFMQALHRALPGLPEEELIWRVHFMIGAMAQTMCGPPVFSEAMAHNTDLGMRIGRLITFLSGGFRAPAEQVEEKR